MTTVSITAKGQITIKKDLLRQMGVRPGEKLEARVLPNGHLDLSPATPKHDISAIFGLLKRPGQKTMTLEEIQQGIEQGAVDSYLRSIGEDPE